MNQPNSSSPLSILHLTAGSDAGGLSRYLLDLCAGLSEAGHRVTLAGARGAWHERFENAGWTWIDVPLKGGPLAFWKSARKLRNYLAEHPVDLLHAHYRRATLLGRALQVKHRPPLLYTLHLSHMPLTYGRRWLSDFGDHVHAASTDARQWLLDERLASEDRITVIPHGIHVERFPVATDADRQNARAALGLSAGDRVAAYVGRLDWPKNEEWLLDLAGASRNKLPDLKILLAGDGPHESAVRQAVAARGLEDRVKILGHPADLPGRRRPAAAFAAGGILIGIRRSDVRRRAGPPHAHQWHGGDDRRERHRPIDADRP
jgi:glycosyltransferase involved in cell wall biosynthesis